MDTKYQNIPDNIDKLLRSSVLEDVLLGIIWCSDNLEIEAALKLLNFQGGNSMQNNYPIHNALWSGSRYLKKGDRFDILLGQHSIEATYKHAYSDDGVIIL